MAIQRYKPEQIVSLLRQIEVSMGYTQWHGFYEVAKTFYTEFIPEAESLLPGVTGDVMNSPYHQWTKGLSKEQLQQQLDFYKKKYNQ
jgi:hypothetical protein